MNGCAEQATGFGSDLRIAGFASGMLREAYR